MLAGGEASTTINLLEPNTMYLDRRNQVDLRFGKVLRFGRTRASVNLDLYNAINSNTVLSVNTNYSPTIDSANPQNNWLAPTVVIHLGNNGTFPASVFASMMEILGPQRHVIVVNVDVARSWETANNAMLAEQTPYYPNVTLVDWFSASIDQPDYFYDDKVHLKPAGAAAYADLIASYVP